MVFGPLGAAAISAGGQLLGGAISAFGARGRSQRDLMAFQRDLSQEMTAWQLKNAPRLEMEGLRRAGINPLLRYGSGGSAAPMGNTGVAIPQATNRLEALGSGIAGSGSSAASAFRDISSGAMSQASARATIARLVPEIQKIEADTSLSQAQRQTELERRGLVIQQMLLAKAQAELPPAQLQLYESQMRNLDAAAFASLAAGALSYSRTGVSDAQYVQEQVRAQRDMATWLHDQQLMDDEFVGFTLRTIRAFASSVFGRD